MKSQIFYPTIPFLISLLAMEFLARLQYIPAYLLPAPSAVIFVLCTELDLWKAALSSALCAFCGFFLSAIFGFLFAVLLCASQTLEKMFFPYTVFFQTVPIIAIAPLLVIWFGYGSFTIVSASVLVSIFPVISYSFLGLSRVDPLLVDLFNIYSASKKDFYLRLRLPYALPQIVTGLRLSAGLSVVGTLSGEWIAGGGLGGIIDSARTLQQIEQVFAAIFLAACVGLLFFAGLNSFAAYLLRPYGGK